MKYWTVVNDMYVSDDQKYLVKPTPSGWTVSEYREDEGRYFVRPGWYECSDDARKKAEEYANE